MASPETRDRILQIREQLCTFIIALSTIIASETLYPSKIHEQEEISNDDDDDEQQKQQNHQTTYRKIVPIIHADPKVCKECCDLALLLLTRRGAAFRSQEAKNLWKA